MDKKYTFKKNIDKDQNVTIEVNVSGDLFKTEKNKVYKDLAKNVKITGFRAGKAPRAMIESRLGGDLFEKTLNKLLPTVTIEVLAEEKLEPLSQVRYEVQKVSDDGVEYKATFVMYPQIKLGNFKKIKIKEEKIEVEKKEIDAEKQRILDLYNQQNATKSSDKKDKKKEGEKEEKKATELTEDILKEMKIGITSLEELEKQITEQIKFEKNRTAKEKRTQEIIEKAITLSKIKAPKTLVDQESTRREKDYTTRIEQVGLKLEDFLKSQKTTLEDLKKTWQTEADARVSSELLMYEIIKTQELKVTNEEVQAELDKITDEKMKKEYDNANGRRTISTIILQQKAIKWLVEEVK